MLPFSWVTSPWVEIKPQYKYILGPYRIEEECQKTNAEQQSYKDHDNDGGVGKIIH